MDRRTLLTDFSAIFTELSVLAALYYQFSIVQTDIQMELQLLPWMGMALVSFLCNLLFTRRGCTIPQLVALNLPLFAGSCALIFRRFSTIEGVTAYLFALLFIGTVSLRCAYLCVVPPVAGRYLAATECAILGVGLLLLMHVGVRAFPPGYVPALFLAVILSFLSNVRERVRSAASHTVAGSRWRGVMLLTAVGAVVGGLLLTLGTLFALPARQGLQTAVRVSGDLLGALGALLGRLMHWLVSLLPPPEVGEFSLGDPTAGSAVAEQSEQAIEMLPGWVPVLAILLLAGLVVAVGIWLSRRIHFARIERAPIAVGRVKTHRGRLRSALAVWFARRMARLRFLRDAVRFRDTPQGLFLWLEWQGKRRGFPRGAGEVIRAYMHRLLGAGSAEEGLREQAESFCSVLECICFGGGENTIDKETLRRLRRDLRGALPKPRKAERRQADADA